MSGRALDHGEIDRLAAAKLWLVSSAAADMPYLSSALFALVPGATDAVARMATDRLWRLYVNPDWLAATPVEEVGLDLAHHVWHLLADHDGRAADMNVGPGRAADWTAAADATIEQVVPAWRAPGGSTRERGLPPGRSAEEYYALVSGLPADVPDPGGGDESQADMGELCGSGCDSLPRSYEIPPDDVESAAVTTHGAEAIRQQVAIEFGQHHPDPGRIPGEWQRWVEQILDPVVPWPSVLQGAVRRGIGWVRGHSDYTYAKPSRRQAVSPSVILPAMQRPVPTVAVVVDTSASVDDGLLAQALGEIDGVLASQAVPAGGVTVLAADAAVHSVDRVRSARGIGLVGGGGTDMAVGIAAALATRPAPNLVVVLTDGLTRWPASPAPVPVVAALLGRSRADLPVTPDWVQRVEVVRDR